MSKVKKIFAIILSMAMILGMSLTTFADTKDSATITVNDENGNALTIYDADENKDGVQLSYLQIIKPDTTTQTGWAFVDEDVENETNHGSITQAFITAFTPEDGDVPTAQAVMQMLLDTERDEDGNNLAITNTEDIAEALSAIANNSSLTFTTATANPFIVNSAGVYAIKAIQEGYTYNTMAAYVGFGVVKDGEGNTINEYPSLEDVKITAKRSPESTTKTTTDEDHAVAVGDTVNYTVTAYVPFIDPSHKDKSFEIWDEITGAEYNLKQGKLDATVVMGSVNITDDVTFTITPGNNSSKFVLDLSDYITTDNAHAGELVTITYSATVTGIPDEDGNIDVLNTASTHVNGEESSSSEVEVYTGTITLTKYNEDKSEQLPGAGFEVRLNNTGEPLHFKAAAYTLNEGEQLPVAGSYIYDPDGEITEVFTGADGTLVIKGLNVGYYTFKETTAPEGYHIKNTESGIDADATLELEEEDNVATGIYEDDTELTNTKLSPLPSTGGIGTTIFTIGGCAIMIAAAGLYFASRRKQENK